MTDEKELQAGIAALEAQRNLLGDVVVDLALGPLRAKLAALGDIGPATPPEQKLKQTTVLFLDIVGSTTLSQQLDPEEFHGVMDGTLTSCTAIVEAHQGKVLVYAGDNLLAVFGADEAKENDPERAVRAGLALLEEGHRRGTQVQQQFGHMGFNVRVGVHTGPVLLGGGVDAERTIRGLTVNIAARMEQTAPPGGLRISHDTYRHVRGVFDVQPQAPIQVKGVDEPIVTYLVMRAKPREFRVGTRGIEGVETRMVGRDVELGQMQAAFERLYGDGGLSAITVVGEAGVGKSRLLYEFQNWAESRAEHFYLFQGRANPQTLGQPYGLLRDILARRFQIADDDSMEVAKRKFELGIVPMLMGANADDLAEANAQLLGHLIGLDFAESRHVIGIKEDANQIRSRGFSAAAMMFRRIAAGPQNATPLVLMLDDLHWGDAGSLDFLDTLAQSNGDMPMLILALTRRALFDRRPGWPAVRESRRINLGALDDDSSRRLTAELLKNLPEVPPTLAALITDRAEGNPFYMEELVKMLIDEGAIEAGGERWQLNLARLHATHIPKTLTGVLQARLDSLPAVEMQTLQRASVIGQVFWDQALASLDSRATENLPALVRRELAVPREDASLDGMGEYSFKHQILHQVTYDTLLKPARRGFHAKVATWLAGLRGARVNDFLGATAEHFEKAGDIASACEYFARAAEHAKARFAHDAALGYSEQAQALLDEDDGPALHRLRWRLLDVRERTLDYMGHRVDQRAAIAALATLAEALDEDVLRGEAAWRYADIGLQTSDYAATQAPARDAMAWAEKAGALELRLRAQRHLSLALAYLGQFDASQALQLEGLTTAHAHGLRSLEALFLNVQAHISSQQGNVMMTLEAIRQTLQIARELGDRRQEQIACLNLGDTFLALGALPEAQAALEEGLKLTRAIGNRHHEGYALNLLSRLALWQGEFALALTRGEAALDILRAVQDAPEEISVLLNMGHTALAQGNYTKALVTFEQALASASIKASASRHDAIAGLAKVALARGDLVAAKLAIVPVLNHLSASGDLKGTERPILIWLTCHMVLAAAGDPRATEMLAGGHAELQARVEAISDAALRRSFLSQIPVHREIVAAWQSQQASANPLGTGEPA
jgi:class 3 adenylate cyclase/tetratricopeptide (TPR) repeat protein